MALRGLLAICVFAVVASFFITKDTTHAAVTGAGFARDLMVSDGLVKKADIFKNCQQIHWCGARRDGTPYCGPTLRCRTCKFVRTCTRGQGCYWTEKCNWGPYQPPIQQ